MKPLDRARKCGVNDIIYYEDTYFQTGTEGGVSLFVPARFGAPEELDRKFGFYAKPWSLASFTHKN